MIDIKVKSFQELTTKELYDFLQLRSEVFVVEQKCIYQDLDGKDEKGLHVMGMKNDVMVAYTRIFKPGDYFDQPSIGRVVVKASERQFKYGYDIMEASMEAIKTHYGATEIKISAQTYLKRFYNNLGFTEVGKEYLEDDIPHVEMIRK